MGDGLRITLNAYEGNIYISLKTILIQFSDGGGACTVTIEKALKNTPTMFTDVIRDASISGGTGWNSYPYNTSVWGGFDSQNNYGILRFTIKVTTKPTWGIPKLSQIKMFGTNCYRFNTNMASSDHAYTWDYNQNVVFPARITAPEATITKTSGFTYTGIEVASANSARNVWFSDSNAVGRPVYNNNFKYNPSTNVLTVGSITGSAATATKLVTARTIKIGNQSLTFDGTKDITFTTAAMGITTTAATIHRYTA